MMKKVMKMMKKNNVFRHFNKIDQDFRGTVVVTLPSKRQVLKMITSFKGDQSLDMGVAFLHPRENSSKEIGREKALSRIVDELLTIKSVEFRSEGDKLVVHMEGFINGKEVVGPYPFPLGMWTELGISIVKNTSEVRLEYLNVGMM